MRPNIEKDVEKVYECFSCGARTSDPGDDGCPDCGNALMNLAASRDL